MKTKAIHLEIKDINQGMKEKIEINLSWSEYYNNKWQPRKTSDFNEPIVLDEFEQDKKFKREKIVISSSFDDSGLIIDIDYPAKKPPYFKLFNKHSAPLKGSGSPPDRDYYWYRDFDKPENKLHITYGLYIKGGTFYGEAVDFEHEVLEEPHPYPYDIVETKHDVTNIFEAPFFYQDRKHVFFVKPEEGLTPVPDSQSVGTYSPDDIIHDITIEPIWESPEDIIIGPRDPRLVKEPPIIRGVHRADPRPIDFSDESIFVNKAVLDNRVVPFGDARIGPMGSQHARPLYNNKLKANLEMTNIKGVIK